MLKAGKPHVAKSKAHVNIFSTPSGKRRFFWDEIFDPGIHPCTKYRTHVLNWREAVGIPEPDPLVLQDLDMTCKDEINQNYLYRYQTDIQYRQWFDGFFPGRTIQEILDVSNPIIDVKEIVDLFRTDRSAYAQKFDNQFTTSHNVSFDGPPETDYHCQLP